MSAFNYVIIIVLYNPTYFSKHLSLSKHSSARLRQSAEEKGSFFILYIASTNPFTSPCSTTMPVFLSTASGLPPVRYVMTGVPQAKRIVPSRILFGVNHSYSRLLVIFPFFLLAIIRSFISLKNNSFRIIRNTTKHCHLMPSSYKFWCNFIDLKLLWEIILCYYKYLHYFCYIKSLIFVTS